jgi:hypothetical protein
VGSLVDWALFVLAPGLPEEQGFAFEAPLFSLEDRDLEEVHRVENLGRVELEGLDTKAWHWALTNTASEDPDPKLELWTAGGELLRLEFDGKQLVRIDG